MAIPRAQLIDGERPGVYHLFSRCVRRAWLCGRDPLSGHNYEHRREWIEQRLLFLCERFAVELYGYAVMSNHYHVVVRLDPKAPQRWSDNTIAERWLDLFPPKAGPTFVARRQLRLDAMLGDAELLARCRQRLGSLSWMMRLLNEPVARRANREDGCTGCFWEGRFESQALLDDAAWLAAMVYVDLNPIRAKLGHDPLTSAHTSIRRRTVDQMRVQNNRLQPLAAGERRKQSGLPMDLAAYSELLLWTSMRAYALHAQRQRSMPAVLDRLGGVSRWLARLAAMRRHDRRAFGDLSVLLSHAKRLGVRWLRGVGDARRLSSDSLEDQLGEGPAGGR